LEKKHEKDKPAEQQKSKEEENELSAIVSFTVVKQLSPND